jgi:large subunit ribosomal protein L1
MPSERRGTVTDDIKGYIERLKGTSEWKADKTGNIHMPIAQVRAFLAHLSMTDT